MMIVCARFPWCPKHPLTDSLNSTDVTVGFEQLSYSDMEGTTVTVCAILTGQIERDVFVTLTTVSGTADGMLT